MSPRRIRLLQFFCFCLLVVLFQPPTANATDKVVLQLPWKHQFQFAGYYAALHKGYYQQSGIDVAIVEGGQGTFSYEELLSGNAQYGIEGAELIIHRSNGDPLVLLATIFQHSPSVLLAKKDSGIKNIHDLVGKRVMMVPGDKNADILAAFFNEGISPDTIESIGHTYNLNDLVEGRVDAISAYTTNEPWALKHMGIEPIIISPQTYGIDFYSDCLFTTAQEVENHPHRVKQFLTASLRGWEYALSNPEEIIDLILKVYDSKKSRAHLRYEAISIRKIIHPELVEIGHTNRGRWHHIAEIFIKLNMIDSDFSFDGFFYESDAKTEIPWSKIVWGAAMAFAVVASIGVFIILFYNRKLSKEIAERNQMEASLRTSEKKLRNIVEHSSDLFYSLTINQQFTYLSPQCRDFFDCEPEEAMTRWSEFLTDNPINQGRLKANEMAIWTGTRQPPYELELKSKKGRILRVEIHETPVLEKGKTVALVGSATDITERHLTEMALKESERRHRTVSDLISDFAYSYRVEPDGEIVNEWVTGAFTQVTGYSRQGLISLGGWEHLIYADDMPIALDQFNTLLSNQTKTVEYRIVTKDGRIRWMRDYAQPTWSKTKERVTYIEGAIQDITERKQAETALKENEAKYAFLAENMADIIWTLDLDLNTTYVSPSIQEILEFTVEERKKQTIEEIVTPESLAIIRASLAHELERAEATQNVGRALTVEAEFYKKDGSTIWLESKVKWVRDTDGTVVGIHGVSRDISVRRQSEISLRESEERYRGVVEDAPGLICCYLPGGEITFVNQTYCDYFSKSSEASIGSNFFSLISNTDRNAVKAKISAITTASPIQSHEHQIISSHGAVIWQRWTHRAIFDSQGTIIFYQAIGEDITDQKQMAIIQKVQYNIANAMVTAANIEASFAIVQKELKEFIDVKQLDLFLYNDKSGLEYALPDVDGKETLSASGQLAKHLANRIIKKNKSYLLSGKEIEKFIQKEKMGITGEIPQVWLGIPFFAGEKLIGALVVEKDDHTGVFDANTVGMLEAISRELGNYINRKLIENEREQLSAAIEQASEDVVITDPEGTIQYVNPFFEHLTGYSRNEVIGQNPRILKSGKQDERFYHHLWETISNGNTWRGQIINRTKDGRFITENATISPVLDTTGKIVNYVAVKRDITEEIRVNTEKSNLQEQLQQAQKVEAIGRLAGGVAHDFNNMLSIILGYSENLFDQLHSNDPLREDVKEIIEAGRRSAALTRQLLAFSRRQALQPTLLNLNEIIVNIEKMLGRLIGEDIQLDLPLSKDLDLVMADPGQIEQVIMNIAVNARDAMPSGGRLIIETANIELDQTYTDDHPSVVPGGYVMFAITDTGFGMDNETFSKIFEPFFTTKKKERGTGLGLSTVYGIVKQSGGNIWVYSELGHGTTFKIYLPIADTEKKVEKKEPVRKEIQGSGEHILVVEDEKSVRNLMAKILSKYEYRIDVAANGGEALLLVEEQGLKPDLVITDVIMPGMSGSALIERLRRVRPDLKVLYMSGYTDNAIVHHGVLDHDTPFIQKPFRARDIVARVQEILRGL